MNPTPKCELGYEDHEDDGAEPGRRREHMHEHEQFIARHAASISLQGIRVQYVVASDRNTLLRLIEYDDRLAPLLYMPAVVLVLRVSGIAARE
jgi:hypothetical protein